MKSKIVLNRANKQIIRQFLPIKFYDRCQAYLSLHCLAATLLPVKQRINVELLLEDSNSILELIKRSFEQC